MNNKQKKEVQYLVLLHPGHNKVFYQSAFQLGSAELNLILKRLSINSPIEKITISNIHYLSFTTTQALSDRALNVMSYFSFLFGLYEVIEKRNERDYILRTINLPFNYQLNPKISTLQKYKGKTNELFTKMMIQIAWLTSSFELEDSKQLKLLDPIAGRGTTLYEAAVVGMHAFGIEIERKSVHEIQLFFRKYLEKEQLKHKFEKQCITGNNKSSVTYIQKFKYANNKEELKQKENCKQLAIIEGQAQKAFDYFKKPTFHFIVGDLPYGVLHGNVSKQKKNVTRTPKEILIESLPDWYKVLVPGGTIAIAWNAFLITRKQMISLFEEIGFYVENTAPYNQLQHMVDQSIKRDIIIAKK